LLSFGARPMPRILQINSSAKVADSSSTRLANLVTARLVARHPGATVEVLDLATHPHPVLDAAGLGAVFTPAASRTPEQAARAQLDDALIAQLQGADVLVVGVPMYNFGVSTQLKAWIDAVVKAGVTFRYGASGPEGLVTGKKVYFALARGGKYRDTSEDVQVPWLRKIFAFIGLTDQTFLYAEGLAMGPDAVPKAFAAAEAEIEAAIP